MEPWHSLNVLFGCLLKKSWDNSLQALNILNRVVEMAVDLMIRELKRGF